MKNTDLVTHVGYTVGGKSGKKNLGTKVRFITNSTNFALRVKELDKMGVSDQVFMKLPSPMTKADAVLWYNTTQSNIVNSRPEIQAAVNHAISRLVSKN